MIYGALPNDYSTMMKERPSEWNFNFRPYGASSEWLWSDSNVQRSAAADEKLEDRTVTALRVSCDESGFDVLVYCNEPSLETYLATSNSFPRQRLEYFVAPGDADTRAIQQHFMCFYGDGENRECQNREPDRRFRYSAPTVTETALANSIVVRIRYDWKNLWQFLPLWSDKPDNFWRLSMIRWVGPGITWGGTVHQNSQAGYIRWPAFTDAQRAAIVKATLAAGWEEFDRFVAQNRWAVGKKVSIPDWKFRREMDAKSPRSYVGVNEDPGFRPVYEAMIAERRALGPRLARVGDLPPAELRAFFEDAADKLFNFRWAVEEAYAKYLADRLFKD